MIYSVLLGALCGWIASMIMKTNEEMGAVKNILAGLLGGGIGNFVLNMIGLEAKSGWRGDVISGIVGACILIFIVKLIKKK